MATVLPFKAIRPTSDKVHLVASRSVDGYNLPELKEKLSGNPYTFLHVINPDFEDGIRTRPGSKERLTKVKKRFKSFIKEKILRRDEKAAYYIYRQIKNENEYIGIIACTSIDDYLSGVIKVHEETITQREVKLKEYLEVCEFNAEPVLFCYPNDSVLDTIIKEVSEGYPDYNFSTTDKVQHTLWVVNDTKTVENIAARFAGIPSIYIADGHHRSASSALLGNVLRKSKKDYTGKEAFNYYLGVFFAETQLQIYDYNRLIKDMGELTTTKLLESLKLKFEIKEINETVFKPTKKHEISMYTANKWYSLVAKTGTYNSEDPVGSLDASILTEHILSPLFEIHDLKIDKRVGFMPGIKGAEALKKSVDDGKAEVAFGLYPVTMEHLKWIADTKRIMPPKSTWVEPKMRSGIVIYSFEEETN
ncbi:DUF1015 domain-containing protein [Aurantibacillus circumpalustris]|uniref:DUF1015 domain-containing protein n=1 Tax=Aurantibacillus circumpalustris TaxID=3036359 RepID=UPI00295C1AAE|nr:DUF1015 domain-containing protein [Aurantibacillus circumpalustris]